MTIETHTINTVPLDFWILPASRGQDTHIIIYLSGAPPGAPPLFELEWTSLDEAIRFANCHFTPDNPSFPKDQIEAFQCL